MRLTHLPTGIVVSCQNERCQLQNKASAMMVLQAKLLERRRQEEQAKMDALKDTGSSWGNQMRSYVLHPYQMVKDLRTEHEVGNPRPCSTATSTASSRPASAGAGARRRPPGSRRGTLRCAVVIRLERVTKLYKTSTRPALDRVSVDIERGEFVFLIGPSGSGKSTFLRLLLREDVPTKGTITVADLDVAKLPRRRVPRLRQRIGCVFQDFRLLPNKTVGGNVAFALEVIGKPPQTVRKIVPEVLELVGLDGKAERMPHELSGGEQQRVAIARAFANRPMVLLADEPTGNLDPDTSQDIMLLLERINRTGTTVLMATHDHSIVDSMRRRVVELSMGKLVRDEVRGVYGVGR